MVIDTELYAKIRKFKNNGASIRYVARVLGISRDTVDTLKEKYTKTASTAHDKAVHSTIAK